MTTERIASAATMLRTARAVGGRGRRYVRQRHNAAVRSWHAERDPEHLVPDPVFILSSVRSGSTLLRAVLDTHRQICAPHELHLNTMRVTTPRDYAIRAWDVLDLSTDDLADMLWDRALHRMLVESGKRIVVDKTPQNVTVWPRIAAYWPQARFIHLRRHPGAIHRSLMAADPKRTAAQHAARVLEYSAYLDSARRALPGPTVRYEQLTAEPERVISDLCGYLGVRFEPRMLRYRRSRFRPGLGDWSANIRSGRIRAAAAPPAEVPDELRDQVRAWGYV